MTDSNSNNESQETELIKAKVSIYDFLAATVFFLSICSVWLGWAAFYVIPTCLALTALMLWSYNLLLSYWDCPKAVEDEEQNSCQQEKTKGDSNSL